MEVMLISRKPVDNPNHLHDFYSISELIMRLTPLGAASSPAAIERAQWIDFRN